MSAGRSWSGVSDPQQALPVAEALAADGVQLIELCGGSVRSGRPG